MVVVDRFTTLAHIVGLATKARTKYFADSFCKEVGRFDGLPSEIVWDMDPKFWSEFGKHCAKH